MILTTRHPVVKTVPRTPRRYSFRHVRGRGDETELNWIVAHLGKDEITALVERFGWAHFQGMWEKAMKQRNVEAA